MTIPRQLGLHVLNHATKEYRLTSLPVPELAALRHPSQSFIQNEAFSITPQTMFNLTEQINFKTSTMELEINLEMMNSPQFSICAFNDENEEACFGFNSTHWFLERSKSGHLNFSKEYANSVYSYAAREINDASTTITIFLDVSSIEVFTDFGVTTMTAVHFPSKPFDKFYFNNWSNATSLSTITVKNFRIYGLECWFGEHKMEPSAGSTFQVIHFTTVLTAVVRAIYSVMN